MTGDSVAGRRQHTISVIICCYTGERIRDIEQALFSVWRQTFPPDEIILAIDNNYELWRYLSEEFGNMARVVLNEGTRGLSATRNFAISGARGEIVAFLDDDAVASPDWLRELVRPFRDVNVFAVGGASETEWIGEGSPIRLPREIGWIVGDNTALYGLKTREVRNPHGGNMAFRRDAILEVGGFDVTFGRGGYGSQVGEEAEICLRVRRSFPNAKVLFAPRARILHRMCADRLKLTYLARRSFQEGMAKGRLSIRYRAFQRPVLEAEHKYLRNILLPALQVRLSRLSRVNLRELMCLLTSMGFVGLGYAWAWCLTVGDFTRSAEHFLSSRHRHRGT